jgi:DNA-binding GntR family transcriptional regulator
MGVEASFVEPPEVLVERTSGIVASMLREAIAEGRVRPGDQVSEVTLAGELGVAPARVREAFEMLAREGLLAIGPRRDARIRALDRSELENMYELRAVLEGHAAARAASRMTGPEIEELRRSCERFTRLARTLGPELNALVGENRTFHLAVMAGARDARLGTMARPLIEVPLVYLVYLWYSPEHREHAQGCHHDVTECIARRDPAAAEAAMRRHVRSTLELVLAHQSDPEDPIGTAARFAPRGE